MTNSDLSADGMLEYLKGDFPIFERLDRNQLLATMGAIALWLGDKISFLPDWQELGIPLEAELAAEQLSQEQLQQILLPYLASRLQATPIPCDCCGRTDSPREFESGFCQECDLGLNSAAALQVCRNYL